MSLTPKVQVLGGSPQDNRRATVDEFDTCRNGEESFDIDELKCRFGAGPEFVRGFDFFGDRQRPVRCLLKDRRGG